MRELFIYNVNVFTENGWINNGAIWIENDKIKEIIQGQQALHFLSEDCLIMDGENLRAIPGFIDSHIHGASGYDVMDGTNKALSTIASVLPQEGTTRFLATTMTASTNDMNQVLKTIGSYEHTAGEAYLEGVHVEGPFIAKERAGAQPVETIIPPDPNLLTYWQEVSQSKIKTITIAPELDDNFSCIKRAVDLGINVSAGHTNATYEVMKQAVKKGLTQVTHLCNAMPSIHHRDVGVIGAVCKLESLFAELIVDGIHVSNDMIELLVQLIDIEQIILITDGMRAKYMRPGIYDLGGQSVQVTESSEARLPTGSLAGSIVKMNEAAKRMSEIKGVSWEDVIKMTSYNPSIQLGIADKTGTLREGKIADIILVDHTFEVYTTICQGYIAHNKLDINRTLSNE